MGFWGKLTGAPEPAYTVSQAWEKLRGGNVDDGRRMLKEICEQQPRSLDAQALATFEFLREPQDARYSQACFQRIEANYPESSEMHSLKALIFGPLFQRDLSMLDAAVGHMLQAAKTPPQSAHGAALLVAAFLSTADLRIQVMITDRVHGMMAQPVLKGMAQFMLRDAEGAMNEFSASNDVLMEVASSYAKFLGRAIDDNQRDLAFIELNRCSCSGMGLTLRDSGRLDKARRAFQEDVSWSKEAGKVTPITAALEILLAE
jgi:hypothetical protein